MSNHRNNTGVCVFLIIMAMSATGECDDSTTLIKGRIKFAMPAPAPLTLKILQELPEFKGVTERDLAIDKESLCVRDVVIWAVDGESRIPSNEKANNVVDLTLMPAELCPNVVLLRPGDTLKVVNTLRIPVTAVISRIKGDSKLEISQFGSATIQLKEEQRMPVRVDFLGAEWLNGGAFVSPSTSSGVSNDKGEFHFSVKRGVAFKLALWHRNCGRIREFACNPDNDVKCVGGYIEGDSRNETFDLGDLVVPLDAIHK